ncbi:MAG: PLP-dependent aminotransferase family protein [Candidatus Xenobiia bacterium LiM19]
MLLKIDRTASRPLFRQIIDEIRAYIDQGLIEVGKPLPPTRVLADSLAVNRSTVMQAYEELQALGYIESRPGSYHTVRERCREVAYNPERKSIISWDEYTNDSVRKLYSTFRALSPESLPAAASESSMVNLALLLPDPRLYPVQHFRSCINSVLQDSSSESLRYADIMGYKPLREIIAKRIRLHGISVSGDEILITNGSQQALDLIVRLLGGTGRRILIESPTYALAHPLLRLNSANIGCIPMRESGMDLDVLERELSSGDVGFVYTIPNFHNPTGITTSHQHREKLLSLCIKHRVPIVEDGFEEDMKYFGKVPMTIKSIDEHNIVIYIGTFSKTLFPGLRLGWMTADRELIQRALMLKRFTDLSSGNLTQQAICRFCEMGYYEMHLNRLHRIYRKRMQVALAALREYMPSTVKWNNPMGGYVIWIEMPEKLTADELNRLLHPHGVHVCHGGVFFLEAGPSEFIRLSISKLDDREISEGMKRLGRALHRR